MAGWRYPERLSLACTPTPLQALDRLTQRLGLSHRIWVKRDDLTGAAVSGNKVRKLEFTLADALAQGADTLVTCGGIQSNHCRATAILGAQLGMTVRLMLRQDLDEPLLCGNLLLDVLSGAQIELHPPAAYKRHFTALSRDVLARSRAAGENPYWITTGASDAVGVWGYVRACEELREDFARHGIHAGAHIVCASGSGGTQAGLVVGNVLQQLQARIWGINVCDDESYFLKKIRADLQAWKKRYRQPVSLDELDIAVIDGYVGEGYGKASDELLGFIADIAGLEGLILDPVYTGKAFYGMVSELQRGRFGESGDIVFLHTGGIFGLQAFAQQFSSVLKP